MKKTVALILALMLAAATLVSCSNPTETSKETNKETTNETEVETKNESETPTSGETNTETVSETETKTSSGETETSKITTSLDKLDEHVKVTADTLTVRSGKDSSSNDNVLGYVSKDAILKRTAIDGDWSKVEYNGKEAYVFSKYVSLTKTADDNYAVGKVTADALNVRSSADAEADNIIGVLTKNSTVDVVSVIDGWARIYYVNTTAGLEYAGEGWVNLKYIEIGDSHETSGETSAETYPESSAESISALLEELESRLAEYDNITASDYTLHEAQEVLGQKMDSTLKFTVVENDTSSYIYMANIVDDEVAEELFVIDGVCCDADGNTVSSGTLYDYYMSSEGYIDYLHNFAPSASDIESLNKESGFVFAEKSANNVYTLGMDLSVIVESYKSMGINIDAEKSHWNLVFDFSGKYIVVTTDMYLVCDGDEYTLPITSTQTLTLHALNDEVVFPSFKTAEK